MPKHQYDKHGKKEKNKENKNSQDQTISKEQQKRLKLAVEKMIGYIEDMSNGKSKNNNLKNMKCLINGTVTRTKIKKDKNYICKSCGAHGSN